MNQEALSRLPPSIYQESRNLCREICWYKYSPVTHGFDKAMLSISLESALVGEFVSLER